MSEPCRCGAPTHESDPQRCAAGHVLVGNTAARTHGVWSLERGRGAEAMPADLRLSVDEWRSKLMSERGGEGGLSALEWAYIRRLTELETVARLLGADLATKGLMTPRGRVRQTYSRWLETLDRWDRYAQRLPGPRPRPVRTLEQEMAGD